MKSVVTAIAIRCLGCVAYGSFLVLAAGCGARSSGGALPGDGIEVDAGADATTDGGAVCRPADAGKKPACSLPFEPGPCQAAMPVFAFVNGACVERTYGGCQGNDNRFPLLEQCMAACEGRPAPCGCSAGRVSKRICVQCGITGGCEMAEVCAKTCAAQSDCAMPYNCFDGVCAIGPCI